jgi:putative membrane protein
MMSGYGMMSGIGVFGILFAILQLLFWAGIIYLIYRIIKKINLSETPRQFTENHDDSLRILNERFAKGEISEEEYKRMKDVLSGKY